MLSLRISRVVLLLAGLMATCLVVGEGGADGDHDQCGKNNAGSHGHSTPGSQCGGSSTPVDVNDHSKGCTCADADFRFLGRQHPRYYGTLYIDGRAFHVNSCITCPTCSGKPTITFKVALPTCSSSTPEEDNSEEEEEEREEEEAPLPQCADGQNIADGCLCSDTGMEDVGGVCRTKCDDATEDRVGTECKAKCIPPETRQEDGSCADNTTTNIRVIKPPPVDDTPSGEDTGGEGSGPSSGDDTDQGSSSSEASPEAGDQPAAEESSDAETSDGFRFSKFLYRWSVPESAESGHIVGTFEFINPPKGGIWFTARLVTKVDTTRVGSIRYKPERLPRGLFSIYIPSNELGIDDKFMVDDLPMMLEIRAFSSDREHQALAFVVLSIEEEGEAGKRAVRAQESSWGQIKALFQVH